MPVSLTADIQQRAKASSGGKMLATAFTDAAPYPWREIDPSALTVEARAAARVSYDLAGGAGTLPYVAGVQDIDVFGPAGVSFDLTMPDGSYDDELVHLITSGASFGTNTVALKDEAGVTLISAMRKKQHHWLRWRAGTETWTDEERLYDGPTTRTGSGSPVAVVTPDFVGQQYRDTTTTPQPLWVASGEAPADWVQVGGSGGAAGDAAPTVVEFAASGNLTAAQRSANNVQVYAGANSIDFNVPVSVIGSWIIRAYDKDDDTPRSGCTVSVIGDAGEVNDDSGAAGIREIVPGGTAIVTSNGAAAPVVKVTGNIFERDLSRGATSLNTAALVAADHQRVITITGTQTISLAVASIPAGFTAVYWASGGDRTIDGIDADHIIPNGGAATVHKNAAGALVCVGAKTSSPGVTVLDAA